MNKNICWIIVKDCEAKLKNRFKYKNGLSLFSETTIKNKELLKAQIETIKEAYKELKREIPNKALKEMGVLK